MKSVQHKFNVEAIQDGLQQFYGTSGYTQYSPLLFPHFLLTDGAFYVAKKCEAHWLFDFIAAHQLHPKIKKHPKLQNIQFWYLTVNLKEENASIRGEWDKGNVVVQESIDYTDFPLEEIRIWVAPTLLEPHGKRVKVAFLPSEY